MNTSTNMQSVFTSKCIHAQTYHMRKEFERKAKAKHLVEPKEIPWPSLALFKERLRQCSCSPARDQLSKIAKEWSVRWHPDKWSAQTPTRCNTRGRSSPTHFYPVAVFTCERLFEFNTRFCVFEFANAPAHAAEAHPFI